MRFVKNRQVIPSESGMSLVEVLVAIVVALLVIAAGFAMLTLSEKSTRATGQVADTQQNVRMAMALLSRDIKVAGFGMVGTVENCTVGAGIAAGLVPRDQNPTGIDRGTDSVSMVVPRTNTALAPMWTLAVPAIGLDPNITLQPGAVAAMQAAGLTDVAPNASTISIGGANSFLIGPIAGDVIALQTPIGVTKKFPEGTPVFLLECVTYAIANDDDGICGANAPCLTRSVNGGAQVSLVDGIEDTQFTYACDGCTSEPPNPALADGEVDTQNGNSDPLFDQLDFISNTQDIQWSAGRMTPDTIRMVQINIVAKQPQYEQGLGEGGATAVNTLAPIVIGDHDPAGDPDFSLSQYQTDRRRVLSRVVIPRNLGP